MTRINAVLPCVAAILVAALSTGCSGLQSEVQKSRLRKAGPTALVGGEELRLQSTLKRVHAPSGKGFDLTGEIKVVPVSGAMPAGVKLNHFALKPGWTGWPGYYVINFRKRGGDWHILNTNDQHPSFGVVTKGEPGGIILSLLWRGQGRGMGTKPEHFATYDVSVTLTDATGKEHILTQLGVPTD